MSALKRIWRWYWAPIIEGWSGVKVEWRNLKRAWRRLVCTVKGFKVSWPEDGP